MIFLLYSLWKYKIPVLIAAFHLIDQNILNQNKIINVILNDDDEIEDGIKYIEIDDKRKIYSSKEFDTIIIEIKEKYNIKIFLELDKKIL